MKMIIQRLSNDCFPIKRSRLILLFLSIGINPIIIGTQDQICMFILCDIYHAEKKISLYIIVTVDKRKPLATSFFDAVCPCFTRSLILFAYHPEPRILPGELLGDGTRVISATIIYKNSLPLTIRLVFYRFQALSQIPCSIINGNDDGNLYFYLTRHFKGFKRVYM